MGLEERHYKDQTPETTVNKLKAIIKEHNLEIVEDWQEESSIGTNALRIVFKGTGIGTNGKGIKKNYALASAYAELFERYQNGLLVSPLLHQSNFHFYYAPDEKWLSCKELINNNSSFIKFYFKHLKIDTQSIKEKQKKFSELNKLDYIIWNKKEEYLTLPFYNYRSNDIEYLPQSIYRTFYGSNGMCAGNTLEEALVQGLSEIIERVVQKKIFLEKPNLPDIPDSYIKKYPDIYKMYEQLQKNTNYSFLLKDCSFGGKYPVAGLIIIEKNTGRFGLKLGCHPNYGIAMERAFTEAAQGQDIYEYVNRSTIDFQNNQVDDWKNIYNSYKVGKAQYPYQIFKEDTENNPFIEVKDVKNLSNKQILDEWMQQIISEGYEILIRDVSCFGFPSYHIIIPGLSEMLYPDEMYIRAVNTRCLISKYMENDIRQIGTEEAKLIIHLNDFFAGNIFENTVSSFYSVVLKEDIPCEELGAGSLYLSAMCYFILDNKQMALKKMQTLLNGINRFGKKTDINDLAFYNAVYHYISAMCEVDNHKQALICLSPFYSEDIINRINNI